MKTIPTFDPGTASDGARPLPIDQASLRATAVVSAPYPGLPPEPAMTKGLRVLEMRQYWGQVLLGVSHYHRPRRVTIGETRRADVFIASEDLPAEEFPLIRFVGDDYVLTFCEQMQGEVELDGTVQPLEALRCSTVAFADDDLVGSYQVPLAPTTRAIVHWGGTTLAMRFVPPATLPARAWWQNVDLAYVNVFTMCLCVGLAAVMTLLSYPYDTEALHEDMFDRPDRFRALMMEPPKDTEARVHKLTQMKAALEAKRQDMQAVRSSKPKPAAAVAKVALRATPPASIVQQHTQQQRQDELRKRFASLLSGSSAGRASVLSGATGGSLTNILSGVIGTRANNGSASAGMVGFGIRGGVETGGRVGTSQGPAGINTAGRAGGFPGYGGAVGLGPNRGPSDLIVLPPGVLRSPLPMEVVRRVIDGNKNQIRYCYEVELQRDDSLAGRVAVSWTIVATGLVEAVQIKESTIHNAKIERCIVDKIKTWRFPAPAGGGTVDVNYPFVLKAT